MLCWLIGWAFFGLFVGAIARTLWPGRQHLGLTRTMFLGVAGSVVGGLIGWLLVGGPEHPYEPAGWIMSILGAILLLWWFDHPRSGRFDPFD
jgi:uncharacterized membrane protein YeaQ/YmgE (transglycosylase-associated protein family)